MLSGRRAGQAGTDEVTPVPLAGPARGSVVEPRELQFLRNIGLLVTYKCQVACPHCIIEAGPHRTEDMPTSAALTWTRQAASYREGRIKILSLTGGEPFIDMSRLSQVSAAAAEAGLLACAVTNAYWAVTLEDAIQTLRQVPELRLLAVSADAYHQRCIPFERVRNAILAAREVGVDCSVAVCTVDENDPEYKAIIAGLLEVTDQASIRTTTTMPVGRAELVHNRDSYPLTPDPPRSACSECATPIVFPNGRVVACIGPAITVPGEHPLMLGDLSHESLDDVLDRAEGNAVLHAIRAWGPASLVATIRESGAGHLLPKMFLRDCICDACYCMMKEPTTVAFLAELGRHDGFRRRVAGARLRLLNEEMPP